MSEKIFGRSWESIQRAQQGGRLDLPIDTSKSARAPATESDNALLREYGSIDALDAAGLHGVADRLRGQAALSGRPHQGRE